MTAQDRVGLHTYALDDEAYDGELGAWIVRDDEGDLVALPDDVYASLRRDLTPRPCGCWIGSPAHAGHCCFAAGAPGDCHQAEGSAWRTSFGFRRRRPRRHPEKVSRPSV